MFIEKEYRYSSQGNKKIYGVTLSVKNNNKGVNLFLNTEKLVDADSVWININNLNDEVFLKEHGIDYVVEEDITSNTKKIIPIGLIDFYNYNCAELNVWNNDGKDLYKANQIIENIEKAIKLKYEVVKFVDKCKNEEHSKPVQLD